MNAGAIPRAKEALRENERKWTKKLMEAGWTAVPSVILERQKALGLDPIDLNIIMHLACHWWYADKLPFPGKKLLADAMQVSARTVQRRIARMERDGIIRRIERWHPTWGQQSNRHDFAGLIKEATPYAEEKLQDREKARQEREQRRKRKRARADLRIVRR
jgi:DNA-binding transcriptional regulator YhcF (GntR family)